MDENNKVSGGYVEVAVKATSFKNACLVYSSYDAQDIEFIFTPEGFSFEIAREEQGEQYSAEFTGDLLYTYNYQLKYRDGSEVPKIHIRACLKPILSSPIFKGSANSRQFRLYFKVTKRGKLDKESIIIIESEQGTEKCISSKIFTPERIIPNLYKDYYGGNSPNSKRISFGFQDLIPENQEIYKGIDFILYSNGKVCFVKKNYLESYLEHEKNKEKKRVTKGKSVKNEIRIEPVPLDQDCKCDFSDEEDEQMAVTPVYSVSLAGTKYQTLRKFAKIETATVQFYMRKDGEEFRPLVIRIPLGGSQGYSTICFADMKPDEMESTPKKVGRKKPTSGK